MAEPGQRQARRLPGPTTEVVVTTDCSPPMRDDSRPPGADVTPTRPGQEAITPPVIRIRGRVKVPRTRRAFVGVYSPQVGSSPSVRCPAA